MQTLLTSVQMHDVDSYMIKQKSTSSLHLMESAASAFVKVFKREVEDVKTTIAVLCGKGNNGGDGLAIARLLAEEKYREITVYLVNFSEKQSDDYSVNLNRITKTAVKLKTILKPQDLKSLKADVIIDAVLGSGLNKPLTGNYADLAKVVNGLDIKVIAVDVPTGLNTENPISDKYNGIKADLAITFQRPKINFFFPESAVVLKRFKVVDIGLAEDFIEKQSSYWKLTQKRDIQKLIKQRKNFSHKGTYGHALIVGGNYATLGAVLLSASASLHTGSGLTTVCLPQSGLNALNTRLPEVMAQPRNGHLLKEDFEKFNVIAFGPGLGLEPENEELLEKIISLNQPIVVDADGLTILSKRNDLLNKLPFQSIITPHLKEFDRLFGEHISWWDRVESARSEAQTRKIIIVLKNQYTFVCLPNGEVHINPTGNPAMASGGMGDVLTGIITSFLAQDYSAEEAAILGVYLHGKAGDELAKKSYTVIASQVAVQIPKTMKKILE